MRWVSPIVVFVGKEPLEQQPRPAPLEGQIYTLCFYRVLCTIMFRLEVIGETEKREQLAEQVIREQDSKKLIELAKALAERDEKKKGLHSVAA
jgi:hypothetical protein